MSLKNVRQIILAVVIALSLAVGATSASANSGGSRLPASTPFGITWQ